MSFDKRLRSIIKSENVSQKIFAEEVGVSVRAIEKYVSGERVPTGNVLMKIVSHERYIKYTMWLLTGGIEEDSDQVSPKPSIQEKCGLIKGDSEKQA